MLIVEKIILNIVIIKENKQMRHHSHKKTPKNKTNKSKYVHMDLFLKKWKQRNSATFYLKKVEELNCTLNKTTYK